jgi:hypothetical protein
MNGTGDTSKWSWIRGALTDSHGEFDVAQIMLPLAVLGMLAISAWSVIVNKQMFDPQQLGVGVGAAIAALGAYKWGDSRQTRPS